MIVLRNLDGRGRFQTLSISFGRRALYKDNEQCSNLKANIFHFDFFFLLTTTTVHNCFNMTNENISKILM